MLLRGRFPVGVMPPAEGVSAAASFSFEAHDNLRPVQIEMIQDAIESLRQGGALVAAAPTGVGKTAAALIAALEVSTENERQRTIMFMTGRQSQHRIVVETVREINRRLPEGARKVGLVDMIGQAGMCVQPFANEHPVLFSNLCSEARSSNKCRPFLANTSAIGNEVLSHPLHVHELVTLARNQTDGGQSAPICPWKIGREMAKFADIIVCDYNHLFIEGVRESSLAGMGIELEDLIVIIDEAHNLPDRIRMGLECKITPDMVRNATFEVDEYLQTMEQTFAGQADEAIEIIRWTHRVLLKLRPALRAWFRRLALDTAANKSSKPDAKQREISITEFHQIMTQAFSTSSGEDNQSKLTSEALPTPSPPPELRLRRLMEVLAEVQNERQEGEAQDLASHRFAAAISTIEQYGNTSALVLVFEDNAANGAITSHLLDPSLVSGPIFSKVSGAVLMSGTLYPPELYVNILGLPANTARKTFASPFMSDRRPVAIASDVNCTFAQRSEAMGDKIRNHIECLISSCEGHIAVFAPSYKSIAEYVGGHNWRHVKVVIEERGWGKQRTDRILDDLEDARRRGKRLLLAGVFGGKLAEGIDYRNNILDAVVCIGIPMAPPSVEGSALERYFNDKFGPGKGWAWAKTQPAMNAVLQAMGRPIRSSDDRAFILLLDERHRKPNYSSCLPTELAPIITPNGQTTEMIAKRFFNRNLPAGRDEGS